MGFYLYRRGSFYRKKDDLNYYSLHRKGYLCKLDLSRGLYHNFGNWFYIHHFSKCFHWFKVFHTSSLSTKYLYSFVEQLLSKILTIYYRCNRKWTVFRGKVNFFYVQLFCSSFLQCICKVFCQFLRFNIFYNHIIFLIRSFCYGAAAAWIYYV